MTDNRKEEIEELTVDLLKEYNLFRADGDAPIFTKSELAKRFNFVFRETALSEDILGAIFQGKTQVKIVVNSQIENVGRKNFTYAHEMGHYFLLHKLSQRFCSAENIEGGEQVKDPQEVEANYFASCFLMPKDYVRWNFYNVMKYYLRISNPYSPLYVDKWHYGNWKNMCSYFDLKCGVSGTALRFRLQELNLLNWKL